MASSSERSPPPFPDSEDQDLLEEVEDRASDEDEGEDMFMSVNEDPLTDVDISLPSDSQPSDTLTSPPSDDLDDSLTDIFSSHPPTKPTMHLLSEPEEFVDLTSPYDSIVEKDAEAVNVTGENPQEEPSDDSANMLRSESEEAQGGVEGEDVALNSGKTKASITAVLEEAVLKVTPPLVDGSGDPEVNQTSNRIIDPLVDLRSDPIPAEAGKPGLDLFEDDGIDLFTEPRLSKPAKQQQKSLFGEADEDLFGEPLGATSKKPSARRLAAPQAAPSDGSRISGPLHSKETADIFSEEAVGTVPSNSKPINVKTNGIHTEEEAELFSAEATVELSLDSPRTERKTTEMPAKPSGSGPAPAVTTVSRPQADALEELEEEEDEQTEKPDIFVSVTDPEKIGDGMNAYMAYRVSTKTSLSMFRNKTLTVKRRFSDFLGLYQKLCEKHSPNGYIVPPPPEKSLLGMTKVKVGKEDSSSADFVERRRGALERYLQRVVNHPSLLQDPDVREFLERDELPRAVSTQALSGAGFLKMLNKATDAVSKMTIKMNESDVWFEDKLQEVESADQHFRKLHSLVETLVLHRKELSLNTASFAKSTAMLGSAEDNTALSRALSQLAEVEDKMEQLHQEQATNDTFRFAELIADFIRMLGAVRGSFDHRMKSWQRWQDAQSMLQKKRETEAKLLWANKPDKLQLAKEEISEWEVKVQQYERDFERVSSTVRKEVVRFEKEKTKNFKQQVLQYLDSLLQSQQQVIKYWEAFLPEAKAIA
ncbi:sorting nexin-1a isoform X1 [Synchiropus splendidus]|uniref:sorting nexin-1a isoform X1 n=1 Tax=Synchiropus splendidus TaxID=270530 RepID=UPI00237DF213|nr:sorting nexin-1a isoform X1 [Synchiropus splendidus]